MNKIQFLEEIVNNFVEGLFGDHATLIGVREHPDGVLRWTHDQEKRTKIAKEISDYRNSKTGLMGLSPETSSLITDVSKAYRSGSLPKMPSEQELKNRPHLYPRPDWNPRPYKGLKGK